MSDPLRDALPASLRPVWEELAELESRLLEWMPAEDPGNVTELADRRSQLLRQFCRLLEKLADADLQEAVLTQLLTRNERLQALGTEALAQASAQSASGLQLRRAIIAYGSHTDEA